MDGTSFPRGTRGRGGAGGRGTRGWNPSRNKHWSTGEANSRSNTPNPGRSDGERWERGGHRGGGRGRGVRGSPRKFPNVSLRINNTPVAKPHIFEENSDIQSDDNYDEYEEDHELHVEEQEEQNHDDEVDDEVSADEENDVIPEIQEPEFETAEEREKFYQELVKAREAERKKAIAEGKMDDPTVPKRLEDAISVVGTCIHMCPRFERYRRERENNLFEWETIPGTKRVDHNRAVKMYERAAGDKTIPSDLRPPRVLKLTLDYLFHTLLPRGGFSATFNFIRDRSRAVRNDFTMQHNTGPLAIECHDRCARFHILALHFERDQSGFSIPLEEQQLMNTLQSLKEFYEDQRGRYESPTELEMRVYHRLIHIRDQKERHEDIPEYITSHPVFKLTTDFRLHVQAKSAPISKTSKLVVTEVGMQIFGRLAAVLHEQGSRVMVYLVACILERLFGKDTIDDIETIRGDLSISDIIDGVTSHIEETQTDEIDGAEEEDNEEVEGDEVDDFLDDEGGDDGTEPGSQPPPLARPLQPNATQLIPDARPAQPSTSASIPAPAPPAATAFGNLVSTSNVFGTFGNPAFGSANSGSVFGNIGSKHQSVFGNMPSTSSTPPPPSQTNNLFSIQPSPSAPPSTTSGPTNLFGNPFATSSKPVLTPSAGHTGGSTDESAPSLLFRADQPSSTPSIFSNNTPGFLNPKATEFRPSQPSQPSTSSQPPIAPPPSIPSFNPVQSTTRPQANGITAIPVSYHDGSPTPPPSSLNKSSPTPSASSTPPPNRPTAPPLLKINTNTSSGSSSPSVASPRVPPPLPKQQPISLPSTPTTVLQPPNPLLGHLRNSFAGSSPSSPSGSQILSPLVIGSPTASSTRTFNNFTPLSTPQASKIFAPPPPPSSSPTKSNGKGKAPDLSIYDIQHVEEMKKTALHFAQRSLLVKQSFLTWVRRTTDRAAYLEARRHGDEYRQKLKQSSRPRTPLLVSRSVEPLDKKRSNGHLESANGSPYPKKRARKRISTQYQPPMTDEDLAKRFKENHQELEVRWAQGSFLQVIRKHVKKLNPASLKLPWHIWLAMNPESDATAIWLERKFDVPDSGAWASESVFSIPLSSASGINGYPGLIVFECTPIGDVTDDLERKYRVLDDCSRLREIIQALPEKRHFIPSLLVICWTDGEDATSAQSDFFNMTSKLVNDSVLQSYHVFPMTSSTKELDDKLESILSSMTLDSEGKLVQYLSSNGAFKIFEPTVNLFLNEWMENCNTFGRFNWRLYAQVVQESITLANAITSSVKTFLELEGLADPLPDFNGTQIDDSDSTYDDTMEWLSTLDSREEAGMIASDIQSHRTIGRDFPARTFIEYLFDLAQARLENTYRKAATTQRPVLLSLINPSLEKFHELLQTRKMKLLQLYNFSVRRSPKRRTNSFGTSDLGSPEFKRPRLLASTSSSVVDESEIPSTPRMNGRSETQTPSPTGSITSLATTEKEEHGPTVTVAMLRALTRDLKKKYGGS